MSRHILILVHLVLGGLLSVSLPTFADWRESKESIQSRGEVRVPVLLARAVASEASSGGQTPMRIALFFPGGEGRVREPLSGARQHEARPSTIGLLAEKFDLALAMGLPSDQASGISVGWRMGREHLTDAGAVIDWLQMQYPGARLTLIGMSNGARSVTRIAAAVASRGTPKLAGVVVMAAAPESLADELMQPLRDAQVPVLVIHHKRDSCLAYRDIEPFAKRYQFVRIDDVRHPRADLFRRDCSPISAHVFSGRERDVYSLLAEWARTGKLSDAGKAD